MGFKTIRLEEHDEVGWLRLARPESHNAVSVEMLEELLELVEPLGSRPYRALVIIGDGRGFCAGLDLTDPEAMFRWLTEAGRGRQDPTAAGVSESQRIPAGIAKLPYPTIAAVHGAAVGGGLELALACDFRIIARGSTLAMPEVLHGLIPDWGGTQRLPRLIGLARATEVILTGDRLTAEQALEYGLAYRLVDAADLEAEADALARRLAQFSPTALTKAKQLLNRSLDMPLSEGSQQEAAAQAACVRSLRADRFATPS